MLEYFVSKRDIGQVNKVCILLNDVKGRLQQANYEGAFEEYNQAVPLFESIKQIGIETQDEQLANSQVVFKNYFKLFSSLLLYFDLLEQKRFKESWNVLQDCLDLAIMVGKHTLFERRMEVPDVISLLSHYEKLYPYKVFCSSEFVISKSHCSICGKSMQSLSCTHRKGNIYWGDVAVEIVDEIKTIQAVCLVTHPENKRCILEAVGDNRSERERFAKLETFLKLGLPSLMDFEIEQLVEKRRKDVPHVSRNSKCICGSGKKFKNCCGKELYYEFERNIVQPTREVTLISV